MVEFHVSRWLPGGGCEALSQVSDVAFHPVHPQLATACYDGRVRFFNSS